MEATERKQWNGNPTDALRNSLVVVGRILIALIFVRAGINKFGSIDATAAEMANSGIPLIPVGDGADGDRTTLS
jgi:uncharacterized membrane protein YphA (DoxX/SURF4 family)